MEIVVKDNGPGIEQTTLDEIRLHLEKRDQRNVGLYNVNSRIRLHCGDEYGLSIDSYGVGTTVKFRLPLQGIGIVETHSKR
ncbi:Histidine kinase-, DNA gyrase B-, and HSP90-like ATPase [compost metagenome]